MTLRSLKRANGNIRKPRRGQTLKIVTTKREFRPYETAPQEGDNLLVRNPETAIPADSITTELDEPDNLPLPSDSNSTDVEQTVDMEQTVSVNDAEPDDTVVSSVSEEPEAGKTTTDDATSTKVADSFRASKAKQDAARAASADSKEAPKPAASKKQQKSKEKKQAAKTHTVRKGESLYKIAKNNGTTVDELKRLNNMKNDKLQPGDKIRVK